MEGSVTTVFSRIDDYILIYQGLRSENVDVNPVGVELDLVTQLTPFWRLFRSMAWIRAQNLTGHGRDRYRLPKRRRWMAGLG
jgi:iron complex outermembrane receptor protein